MSLITGQSPEVARILDALGNSNAHVRSLVLHIQHNKLVTVTVERLVTDEECDTVADLFDTCEFVLLPRKDGQRNPEIPEPQAAVRGAYRPQEIPRRYPLELTPDLHVCLWFADGSAKYTMWVDSEEGPEFRFVGDRPLDSRINWEHLRDVIRQGQSMAEVRWRRRPRYSS
jgi:hypothetical protein